MAPQKHGPGEAFVWNKVGSPITKDCPMCECSMNYQEEQQLWTRLASMKSLFFQQPVVLVLRASIGSEDYTFSLHFL